MKDVTRRIRYIPLDRKVITVAKEGAVNDWAAYIGAVEGVNHTSEWQHVADFGTKLPQEVAEVLFPTFAKRFTWRP